MINGKVAFRADEGGRREGKEGKRIGVSRRQWAFATLPTPRDRFRSGVVSLVRRGLLLFTAATNPARRPPAAPRRAYWLDLAGCNECQVCVRAVQGCAPETITGKS